MEEGEQHMHCETCGKVNRNGDYHCDSCMLEDAVRAEAEEEDVPVYYHENGDVIGRPY
jgi:hypothetical protein